MNTKPYRLVVRGILIENNKVLLCQRSHRAGSFPGLWELPGGKVDSGEDFDKALVREFREETGLSISLEKVLGAGELERGQDKLAYLFLLVSRTGGEVQISHEHDAYAWYDSNELQTVPIPPQLQSMRDTVVNILKAQGIQ